MLRGVNKTVFVASIFFLLCICLSSCGESKEKKAARELLARANELSMSGNFSEALALVDSIPVLYPKQTEVRREALALQPVLIENITLKEIEECESEIARMQQEYMDAKSKMTHVENPELVEGYWIASKGNKQNLMDATGIQARVSDAGEFYIVSEVNGAGNLHHNSITLSLPSGESASSGIVNYDGELNYRINGSETVTFSREKSDTIGYFANVHNGEPMTLMFNGENGAVRKVKLTDAEVGAIADAYSMAVKQLEGRRLVSRRELLERKLAMAREQQKRLNKTDN